MHGVASGDPGADRVIIWTRLTTVFGAMAAEEEEVTWELAEDEAFSRVAARGETTSGRGRDGTVKVDVTGLQPSRDYFYRFKAYGADSPVGRTRTLPVGRTRELRLAVVSCTLIPAGWFNAYAEIAREPRLDAVLHLGDYLYEYGGPNSYGVSERTPPERMPQPQHECVSLVDYRTRHAQYKEDPDLQAAHAAHPWIVTWDDHEVANDTWVHGAENHQPATEGLFDRRKAAALQAYYEWMPIREPAPGRAREAVERSFDFGDLATLVIVETRLQARSQQVTYGDKDLPRAVYDASDPARRVRVTDPAVTRRVMAEVEAGRPAPAPYRVSPEPAGVLERLSEPSRQLLGARQEGWIAGELHRSVAAGRPWQVIGNQVVMGRAKVQDVVKGLGGAAAFDAMLTRLSEAGRARLRRLADLGPIGLPYNLDSWDGYPAARERLLRILKASGGNPVVLAGDSHSFWVNELRDAGGARVAAEFGTSSVTSPSAGDSAPQADLGAMLAEQNPEILFCDQASKGYVRLTFTRDLCRGELISTGVSRPYTPRTIGTWTVRPSAGPGVGAITRA